MLPALGAIIGAVGGAQAIGGFIGRQVSSGLGKVKGAAKPGEAAPPAASAPALGGSTRDLSGRIEFGSGSRDAVPSWVWIVAAVAAVVLLPRLLK